MMNIIELPPEILENIFSNFLPSDGDGEYSKRPKIKQLLDCTLACRLFNEVIGQSERLMSAIKIRWNEGKDPTPFLTTSRIYRNIDFGGKSGASFHLVQFLKTQPKLSCVCLDSCKLRTCELPMIIDFVRNSLEELELSCLMLNGDPLPICTPNLRKLTITSIDKTSQAMEKIYGIFNNSEKLEEFHFCSHTFGSYSSNFWMKVEAFLIDCKRLKKLFLNGSVMDKIYEASNFAERASFQLEEIQLSWDYSSNPQTIPNFLYNQAFLKDLTFSYPLVTDDLLNTILGMKTLKKLVLFDPELKIVGNIHVRSTSIKTLDISNLESEVKDDNIEWYTAVCKIIKGCPAVQKLLLCKVSFSDMVAKCIMDHQKGLQTLQVDIDNKIHLINIPTLRTMILEGLDRDGLTDDQAKKVLDLIMLNPQLTKIKICSLFEDHEKLEELPNLTQAKLEYFDWY